MKSIEINLLGKKNKNQRPILKKILPYLFSIGLTAVSYTAQGHDTHENISASHPNPTNQSFIPRTDEAQKTQEAQFVDTAFTQKASSQQLPWADVNGKINIDNLINHWQSARVRPEQGMKLLHLMLFTQSPALYRNDFVKNQIQQSSLQTQLLFDIQNRRNADFFLSRKDANEIAEIIDLPAMLDTLPEVNQQTSWHDVKVYWEKISASTAIHNEVQFNGDYESAMKELQKEVNNAGLSGLIIPITITGDANKIYTLSQNIKEANNTLRNITGIEGQTLGLNGRVLLNPIINNNIALTQLVLPKDINSTNRVIRIDSNWQNLPHEWIHALDFSLRSTPIANEFGGVSLSHQVSNLNAHYSNNSIEGKWQNLYQKVIEIKNSTEWNNKIEEFTHQNNALKNYITSPSESIGYAFGAYVQATQNQNDIFYSSEEQNKFINKISPSLSSALSIKESWNEAFASINNIWFSNQNQILSVSSNNREDYFINDKYTKVDFTGLPDIKNNIALWEQEDAMPASKNNHRNNL